jgi:hypothetical protein
MTPRKPSAGFWITVALVVVLVGYPLSIGPEEWLYARILKGGHTSAAQCLQTVRILLFAPLRWCRDSGPKPVADAYWWYLGLWVDVHPGNIHRRAR